MHTSNPLQAPEPTPVSLVDHPPVTLQRRVLSMRYQGYEVDDISHALSLTPATVRRFIDQAIAIQADEVRADIVREAELAKLEEMEPAFLDAAVQGSHKAAATVLKFMERRAALLGVDRALPSKGGTVVNLVQVLASMSDKPPVPHFQRHKAIEGAE